MDCRRISPSIDVRLLPDAEHPYARAIDMQLFDLQNICRDFDAAAELLAFARKSIPSGVFPHRAKTFDEFVASTRQLEDNTATQQTLMGWIGIAVRDGVGTIFRQFETMGAIGKNLRHCPELRGLMDMDSKKQATKAFKRHFPVAKNMRDVTVHSSGEIYGTLAGRAKHALPRDGLIVSSVSGDVFETTFERKLVQVAINAESTARLAEVRELYWRAFAPLDGYQRAFAQGTSR